MDGVFSVVDWMCELHYCGFGMIIVGLAFIPEFPPPRWPSLPFLIIHDF